MCILWYYVKCSVNVDCILLVNGGVFYSLVDFVELFYQLMGEGGLNLQLYLPFSPFSSFHILQLCCLRHTYLGVLNLLDGLTFNVLFCLW